MEKRLWTTEDVADFLGGIKPRTLAEKRTRGDGPPYLKLSPRMVRYDPDVVREWAAARARHGTFEDRREAQK